ncbi:MAG TPA: MFS transporter [Marmoricola sp.]|nr:MFS transporter [Marmoricola sp.]
MTVLGTMCNNIVNVPLRTIATGLDAPLSAAVLLVSAFVLALAIAMPLTGWLGDRIGMKLTLLVSLALMLVAQALAALAPNLPTLVTLRAVQGLACSAIPPMVMGLLSSYHPDRRLQMMAAWAAANGVGQAIGPPVGGLVSDAWGWRMIFVLIAAACLVVLVLLWWCVPAVPARASRLDVRGAVLLTGGVGLTLVAITTISQREATTWAIVEGVGGVALLLGYGVVSRGRSTAMIPLPVLLESRFLRSTAAAFAQMFSLGTVLVALPLLFTGPLGMSTAVAGALFFMLPGVMAVSAPASSWLSSTYGPRRILRTGMVVIALGTAATGLVAASGHSTAVAVVLTAMLLVLGFGMALVQTPAAAGATGSPAGRYGAAVGLFSMMRFSGSATAAAWVALVYPTGSMLVLFGGCVVVAVLGLAASYAGPDPVPLAQAVSRTSGRG